MATLQSFFQLSGKKQDTSTPIPALFIGHGSPMNGIENNEFSNSWKNLSKEIPEPKAIICISAHWLTRGTYVTEMPQPKTIHDFGGFPQELFEVQYPAPGSPELAHEMQKLINKTSVGLNNDWGLDHGTWTILRHIYPDAQIPVLQLSIDYHKPAEYHYELGKELLQLRKKGILMVGSGNLVHNLGMVAWEKMNDNYGFDWAEEISEKLKKSINEGDFQALINYHKMGKAAELAIPTPDHYYPLLYVLALKEKDEKISFFNDKRVGGSLSMTSVIVHS
jgi:4,5-DOPA dioxygenase extradiol